MVNSLVGDFDARVYGPQRIAAVVETLEDQQVAASMVLAGSGLSREHLYCASTKVSYRQVAIVFGNALRLSQDPETALIAGARMHLSSYGIFGFGLLSSPNHIDEIEFSIAFSKVMGPVAGPISYTRSKTLVTYDYDVYLSPDPFDPLYRFSLEFALSAHFTLAEILYRHPAFSFSTLRLVLPDSPCAEAYRRRFGCDVVFGASRNQLEIASDWLSQPQLSPDRVTHDIMRQECTRAIAAAATANGLASRIYKLLVKELPWRFPNIDAMAEELKMHPRTLRRRLTTQGTSYREILTMVRRRLAIAYLRETQMSSEEIASRLGYSDASNFRHAFIRWTGKSPQTYRNL
ncbi:AraC family transcriptional regulator [Halopseudomonas maritima]|uniref:AraC family transcriptional regulator n=1 Tax=Halopseudomonas maritima TaxID=2918528 RepID=UPI001EEAEAAD|nr:AraC family transcriptional regulator [Halopseudomonas maritima]UJJ33079.1 AraC family transcriptional regulator [Halopseudomonas maritima]